MVEPFQNPYQVPYQQSSDEREIHVNRAANQLMQIFQDPNQTPQSLMGILPNLFKGGMGDFFKQAFSRLIAAKGYVFNPGVGNVDMWQEAIKFAAVQPKDSWNQFHQQPVPDYVREDPTRQKMSIVEGLIAGNRNRDNLMLRMQQNPGFREDVKQVLRDIGSDPDAGGGGHSDDMLIDALLTVNPSELEKAYPGALQGSQPGPNPIGMQPPFGNIPPPEGVPYPEPGYKPPVEPPPSVNSQQPGAEIVDYAGFNVQNGDYMVVYYLLTNNEMRIDQKQDALAQLAGSDPKFWDLISRVADFAGVYGQDKGAFKRDDPLAAIERLFTYGGVNLSPVDWKAVLPENLDALTQAEKDVAGRPGTQGGMPWQNPEENYSTLRYLLSPGAGLPPDAGTLSTMLKRYSGLFEMARQALERVAPGRGFQNASLGQLLAEVQNLAPEVLASLPKDYTSFEQGIPIPSDLAAPPGPAVLPGPAVPPGPMAPPLTENPPAEPPPTANPPDLQDPPPPANQPDNLLGGVPDNKPPLGNQLDNLPAGAPGDEPPPTVNGVDNYRGWIWSEHVQNLLNNPNDQNSKDFLVASMGNDQQTRSAIINFLYDITGQNFTDNHLGAVNALTVLNAEQKPKMQEFIDYFIPSQRPPPVVPPPDVVKVAGYGEDWAPRPAIEIPDRPWARRPMGNWSGGTWIPSAGSSPNVEYQESLNALLPWMSPQDQMFYADYLAAVQPDIYGRPGEQYGHVVGGNAPALARQILRPEQQYQYAASDRMKSARDTLMSTAPGFLPPVDPDSPVYLWLDSVLSGAQQYAPSAPYEESGIPESGSKIGNRRTRMQQAEYDTNMQNWLSPDYAAGFGVKDYQDAKGNEVNQYSQWSEFLKRFLAPTFMKQGVSERAVTPTWRQNQFVIGQPGQNLGYGYQQPRWL